VVAGFLAEVDGAAEREGNADREHQATDEADGRR
jgi:hypothetical protein